MKKGYIILTIFLILTSIISSAFARDSQKALSSQQDSTQFLNPDQKFLSDSLNLKMSHMFPYHYQAPKKYPDSKMSLGPADNYIDSKITIMPADNSMDPKISIPLNYTPGPFYRKFNEKRDFRFPERYPKHK